LWKRFLVELYQAKYHQSVHILRNERRIPKTTKQEKKKTEKKERQKEKPKNNVESTFYKTKTTIENIQEETD